MFIVIGVIATTIVEICFGYGIALMFDESQKAISTSKQDGNDLVTVKFQISSERKLLESRFSEKETVFTSQEEAIDMERPLDAFKKLKKGHYQQATDEPKKAVYFVGQLKGEIYSIDKFKFLDAEQNGDELIVKVRYTRKSSPPLGGTPGPARAYFVAKAQPGVTKLTMKFEHVLESFRPIDDVEKSIK